MPLLFAYGKRRFSHDEAQLQVKIGIYVNGWPLNLRFEHANFVVELG